MQIEKFTPNPHYIISFSVINYKILIFKENGSTCYFLTGKLLQI